MEAVILVIHLIVAVGLIIMILIQPSEAGGFMGTGSMSNLMAPRRGADVMTRTTTILAGCFFATSMLLAIVASNQPASKSILDVDAGTKKTEKQAPAPAKLDSAIDNAAEKQAETKKEPVKPAVPKAPVTR